jgi:hypothetical protein
VTILTDLTNTETALAFQFVHSVDDNKCFCFKCNTLTSEMSVSLREAIT